VVATQAETVRVLAQAGVRVALTASAPPPSEMPMKPSIVRMERNWLRAAMQDKSIRDLLRAYIAACRSRGAEVLASDLDSPQELRFAVGIGADLFEGAALGQPRPLGAVIDLEPVRVPVGDLTVARASG